MAATEPERADLSEEVGDVAERLQDSANARTVFGDPVEREGRTVIPVARVAYGFGGGFGDQPVEGEAAQGGTGAGMGGGVMAKPVGALEVTDHETRFVPLRDSRRLLLAAGAFLAGAFLGALSRRRSGD